MPRENVELVKRFLDLVNADELDLAMSCVAPDAALDWSRSEAPDSGIHRGPEEWLRWIASRREELSDARFDVEELIDLPPDRVVLVAYMRGVGRASGLVAEGLGASIIRVRDGSLAGITLFQSKAEALEAAGRFE